MKLSTIRIFVDYLVLKSLIPINPNWAAQWLNSRFWLRPTRLALRKTDEQRLKNAHIIRAYYQNKLITGYRWGTGTPILLMHGWGGRATQFIEFIQPLTEQGFQVIAIDAPAHGASEGSRTDFPEIAQVIHHFIQQWGPFYAIVCHSAAIVPVLIALQNDSTCKKIISLNPFATLEERLMALQKQLKLPADLMLKQREQLMNRYGKELDATYSPIELIKKYPGELHVFHDKNDREVPFQEGEKLAQQVQGKFFLTEKLGHYRILKDPQVIQNIINSLADQPSS